MRVRKGESRIRAGLRPVRKARSNPRSGLSFGLEVQKEEKCGHRLERTCVVPRFLLPPHFPHVMNDQIAIRTPVIPLEHANRTYKAGGEGEKVSKGQRRHRGRTAAVDSGRV